MPKKESDVRIGGVDELDIVLCGTFGRGPGDGQRTFDQLTEAGLKILSPKRGEVDTKKGVKLRERQLEAIQRARLVWLHAPDGKVEPETALELGFAKASGVPLFTTVEVRDVAFRGCISIVSSAQDLVRQLRDHKVPPPSPSVRVFQHYYRKAIQRREDPGGTAESGLLAMAEVFGNLSRAIRKREGLVRHGTSIEDTPPLELAELFISTIAMANLLDIDLSDAVQAKEVLNIEKLLTGKLKTPR